MQQRSPARHRPGTLQVAVHSRTRPLGHERTPVAVVYFDRHRIYFMFVFLAKEVLYLLQCI